MARELDTFPEELEGLDAMLSDTYFCNFSLFQSMPDSWAIKQLFPIMPIHRLEEKPTQHAVLGDITCDSDGKVDQFIDRRDVKRTLPLHDFTGGDYYIGAFLVGAYQEILGDLHNLFGDTNAVHVRLSPTGEMILDEVIKGDTVREVLITCSSRPTGWWRGSAASVEAARARRPADVRRDPGSCFAFTKKDCTGTRTWKTSTSGNFTHCISFRRLLLWRHVGRPFQAVDLLSSRSSRLKVGCGQECPPHCDRH